MIEVTKEMVQEIYSRIDFHNHGDDGIAEGLTAVLALVERDYQAQAQREWDALQPCPAPDPSGVWFCERVLGHAGKHTALRWYEVWT